MFRLCWFDKGAFKYCLMSEDIVIVGSRKVRSPKEMRSYDAPTSDRSHPHDDEDYSEVDLPRLRHYRNK